MKKILIITSSIDYTVDYIIDKYKTCDFYRLNVDMLKHYNVTASEKGWKIECEEWDISSSSIYSIYYRKPRIPDLSDYEKQYTNMIQKDIIALIEGLVNSFDGYVLSKPNLLHLCENKAYQMQMAQKVGFKFPKSIITNNKENANKFIVKRSIIKPISAGKIIYDNNVEIFQTNVIDNIDEDINVTPIYLQEYINKKYEVRATFVGQALSCVKIQSTNKVDWRDNDAINKYELIDMPNDIYDKCIKLMQVFNLDFGAFDFIIDNNNNWVFLEINPNGQWLWLEEELKLQISNNIVDLLNGKKQCSKQVNPFIKIVQLIAKIWSYSIIFPFTDDKNFGTNELENGNKNSTDYRISLIGFFFGNKAMYFLTYSLKHKKFSFLYEIFMEKCSASDVKCNESIIEEKAKKYEQHLNDLSIDDRYKEIEFIKYLNERQRERIQLGERKISLYSTVILAIIPILLVLFDINIFLNYTIWEKLIVIYDLYFLLNVVLLIFDSMKVKGYSFSMFSKLKESKDKEKKLNRSYYFDWQMNKDLADIFISYVINIQDFIKYALLLSVILTISYNVRTISTQNNFISNNHSAMNVISLNIDDLKKVYSKDSIELTELKLTIQKRKCENIIVLIPDESYKAILSSYFIEYNDKLIKYYIDKTLNQNHVKIIEE